MKSNHYELNSAGGNPEKKIKDGGVKSKNFIVKQVKN